MKRWNEKVNPSYSRTSTGLKIKHLVEQLAYPEEIIYARAGRRLILSGADAVDYLIDALEDDRIWIQASVLLEQIWARLKASGETLNDEEVDKLIVMALEKKSKPVGKWIIRFLKRIDTPRTRKGLHDLLGVDDDDYVATTVLLEMFGRELAAGKYRL